MTKATEVIQVPDYSEQSPHGMIGSRMVWSLEPGELLWIPADTQWGFNRIVRQPEGLVYEVAYARPVRRDRYVVGLPDWEVVAFGATMLRLEVDYDDLVQVVLPHVPAICPTCRDLFNQARRSAGLNIEED